MTIRGEPPEGIQKHQFEQETKDAVELAYAATEKQRMEALRDQFAAAALTGVMLGNVAEPIEMEVLAEIVYEIADAMLAEREKK